MATDDEKYAHIKQAISADGGLYDLGWYLEWNTDRNTATLDGEFTAQELREIAEYMDEHKR